MGPYAQAITSRYEDILRNGQVLEGDMPYGTQGTEKLTNNYTKGYQFYSSNPNKIVMVRKHNTLNKWVIGSTIQDNINTNNTPELEQNTTITLNGEELTFRTRKQGSVYIYDKTDLSNISFYQLDGWHDWKHPIYWDTNFTIESELYDVASNGVKINTERPVGVSGTNYSAFTSYITFSAGSQSVKYVFEPRPSDSGTTTWYFYMNARAKSNTNNGGVTVNLYKSGTTLQSTNVIQCLNNTS